MAHVTFIHGIANKPAHERLLRLWRDALTRGQDGLDLGAEGVSSSMVYWADVLYDSPDDSLETHESAGDMELEAVRRDEGIEDVVLEPVTPTEKLWLAQLAAKFEISSQALTTSADYAPPETEADGSFERVPLPWFIKRRLMKILLRDVHHYLFDVEHSPRAGATYRVQQEIRKRFVEDLTKASQSRPHVVVSHSMGTVIAYDCLKRVADCPPVDGLITVGSPLGLDEIQGKLQPGWTRPDGFPRVKVRGEWVSVFDHLDPVAGFDPFLCSDFREGGREVVEDIHEPNYGKWRHDLSKYFAGRKLRAALQRLLRL
jgi:hypothetical protein